MLPKIEDVRGLSKEGALLMREQIQRSLAKIAQLRTNVKVHVSKSGEVEFLPDETEQYRHYMKVLGVCNGIIAKKSQDFDSSLLEGIRHTQSEGYVYMRPDDCKKLFERIEASEKKTKRPPKLRKRFR